MASTIIAIHLEATTVDVVEHMDDIKDIIAEAFKIYGVERIDFLAPEDYQADLEGSGLSCPHCGSHSIDLTGDSCNLNSNQNQIWAYVCNDCNCCFTYNSDSHRYKIESDSS